LENLTLISIVVSRCFNHPKCTCPRHSSQRLVRAACGCTPPPCDPTTGPNICSADGGNFPRRRGLGSSTGSAAPMIMGSTAHDAWVQQMW